MATGNFGERLRREREMREVSIEEIVKSTRISRRYLEALEREDWSKLPGGVFARGFVRSVARYLGLDEESLLGEYDLARKTEAAGATPAGSPTGSHVGSHAGQQRTHAPDGGKIPSGIPRWLTFVLFVLILAGIAAGAVYAWRSYAAHRNSLQRTAQPPASIPDAASAAFAGKPAAAHAAADEKNSLELSVSTNAATRVRVAADGATIFDGEMPAGQNLRFRAAEQFEVTAADSSAVLLELNGQVMPPIGAPGASGTIRLSGKDLKQPSGGTTQP